MQTDARVRYLFMLARTALLVSACGLVLAACQRGPPPSAAPPPEVATVTVTPEELLLTLELPGRTVPYLIAEIRPQVNGLIQRRLFIEGADVQAGQDLYQVDAAPFQAALDNAEAAQHRAEANLPALRARVDRLKEALTSKAVSLQAVDDAEAALNQAEADAHFWAAMVKTARINLGYARIKSPISGRIGKSTVTDGAIVTAYQPLPLTTVQQLDPIYVDVPQSTARMLKLKEKSEQLNRDDQGMKTVQLIQEDGTPYPLEGTLQFRDVSVDPTTGSVILRMVFPNPNGVLLPGMFVRAMVKEGLNQQAILVPQQAVLRDPRGNPLVLLMGADGKVEQRAVTLERAVGNRWLVASGLQPGDKVIVEGGMKVRPGMAVREVPFSAAFPAGGDAPVGEAK